MPYLRQFWSLVWEPVRFFEHHRCTCANWRAGAVAPFICAALYLGYGIVMTARLEPVVLAALEYTTVPQFLLWSTMYGGVVAGALAFPLLWLASAGFLVSVDALFVDRGRPLKQLELAGRVFLSQVPCLVVLLCAAVLFDNQRLSNATITAPERVASLRADLAAAPLFGTATVLTHLSRVWLCSLLAMSYQSIARISHRATVVLVAILYGVFFLASLMLSLDG